MKLKVAALSLALLMSSASSVFAGGVYPPENLKVAKIECKTPYTVTATFSWDSEVGATGYRFYSRFANTLDNAYAETEKAEYKLVFDPHNKIEYQVTAYHADDPVVTDNQTTINVYESDKLEAKTLDATEYIEKCKDNAGDTKESELKSLDKKDTDASKVAALEEKVKNLEGKVSDTQKKQSALEKIVSNIQNFLAHLFHFK